jgi:nucleotidyltransferase substrate binding protein (TIGR01987 family)
MDSLIAKHKNLIQALKTLQEAIENCSNIKIHQSESLTFMDNTKLYIALRDSSIQRFEFCVDLFWKYLKKYLEDKGTSSLEVNSPKTTIKTACKAGLLEEDDAELALKMIEGRNLTSHIYKDEFAEKISSSIASYYILMQKYAEKIVPY